MIAIWGDGKQGDAQRQWALRTLVTTSGLPVLPSDSTSPVRLYIYDAAAVQMLPAELSAQVSRGAGCVAIGGECRTLERIGSGLVFWTGQDELAITIQGLLLLGKNQGEYFPSSDASEVLSCSQKQPSVNRALTSLVEACHQVANSQDIYLPTIAKWPGARRYAACLTHDVDYVGQKGFLSAGRIAMRALRDVLSGHWQVGGWRVQRMLAANLPGSGHDPYDNFEQYQQLESEYGARSSFFLMVGHYLKRYGASYRLGNSLRSRIEPLATNGWEIGLHGSYYGFDNVAFIRAEKEALESFIGRAVVGGRQHWLHWQQPQTWHVYCQAGLLYDSSVGYRNYSGYPTQFTFPYRPFDHLMSAEIDLWELPLTIMDSAMFNALGLDGDAAWQLCDTLTLVAQSNGLLTVNWHQCSFDTLEFPNRKSVYTQLLRRLAKDRAWMTTGGTLAEWWQARAQLHLVAWHIDGNKTIWTYQVKESIGGVVLEFFTFPGLSVTTDVPATIAQTQDTIRVQFGALGVQQRFSVVCEKC